MKKKIALLLSTLMLTGVLSACGEKAQSAVPGNETPTEVETPAEVEKTVLKWAIWDIEGTPYWKALEEAYEAKNKNVDLELVDLGSADYMTVLATELSGTGSDFDVVTIKDVPGYATLVNKNTLEPLGDYITSSKLDIEAYGTVIDQITVNENLYQLPFRNDFWLVYYNKDIFDRAGKAYPTNDMTFEEYDALARSVTDTTFGEQVYGAHYHTWRSAVQLFGVLDGEHTILDGEYEFFKPYYEMVLNQTKDGVTRDYVTLSTEGLHYSGAFSNGDVAMMNMGSWFISTMMAKLKNGEYNKDLVGNWGLAKYPHADGVDAGSTLGTVTGLAVTAVTEKKDAAWDFVQFVGGADGAKVLAETGNFPAVMTEQVQDIISGMEGFPEDEESKEALKVSNLYLEVPYHENVSEINAILDTYHKDIMNGDISVDDGLKKMNEEVGKVLKQ